MATLTARKFFNHANTLEIDAVKLEGKVAAVRYRSIVAHVIARIAATEGWAGEEAVAPAVADATFKEWVGAQSFGKTYAARITKLRRQMARAVSSEFATTVQMVAKSETVADGMSLFIAALEGKGLTDVISLCREFVDGFAESEKKAADKAAAKAAEKAAPTTATTGENQQPNQTVSKTPLQRILQMIEEHGQELTSDEVDEVLVAVAALPGSSVVVEDKNNEETEEIEAIAA